MTHNQNTAIVRRFIAEVLNGDNLPALDELVAADYVDHAIPPQMPPNRESMRQLLVMLRSVFPDIHYATEDVIAADDKVVVRFTRCGTQRGEFMAIAPSGHVVQWTGVDIFRIEDGKIVEHWNNFDQLGMLQQLGAELKIPQTT